MTAVSIAPRARPKRIADLIDDANAVLAQTLALRFELDRIVPWSTDVDPRLQPALEALHVEDEGEGVDLVVGMISALPRETDSLHELGMAPLLGKHIVVRSASLLGERLAVDQGFGELGEDERARLVRARERHRALAVLLHELGHTLGAVHETDVQSLMHPSYDTHMSGFSDPGIALMRAALDDRDPLAVARAQLAILRGSGEGAWMPTERDERIAQLETLVHARAGETETGPAVSRSPRRPGPPVPARLRALAAARRAELRVRRLSPDVRVGRRREPGSLPLTGTPSVRPFGQTRLTATCIRAGSRSSPAS